jgi:steroid 5-alpha reductase family enzyme
MPADLTDSLIRTALALWAFMSLAWLVSVLRRDTSIIDAFWGPGLVVSAWVSLICASAVHPLGVLITGLVSLWGARLGWHLLRRNLAQGEDRRYREMREKARGHWVARSYLTVFMLQGALLWLVSAPLQTAIALGAGITPWREGLSLLGVALFVLGMVFEAVADAQLDRFKRDPANKGKVMDRGLWRYSRHPNYFGEACIWWGLFLTALPAPLTAWTLFSPALVTLLLLKVSGLPLAEKGMESRRPGYADYARRTSAFIPLPPR